MSACALALVGCGKKKGPALAPTRQLYTSNLFRFSLAFAEAHAPRVFVTSAYYGLLHPDTEVEPYDLQLGYLSGQEQIAWAKRVVAELGPASEDRRPVLLLAGGDYARLLHQELRAAGWEVEEPLRGMDLFERLRWLRGSAIERAARSVPASRWGS